ncbi:MAG: Gfo/Idh/MocA family oxidoreductase [Bdellovibrionales bacterium]|nr:Gfo/Idh/MocA family oxidoreductase [Bdellovibrionales bacterium]
MSRVLVTGAGGFIGGRVAREAAARGHEVRSLLHRASGGAIRGFLPAGEIHLGALPWDLPIQAFDGVDAIVHCARSGDPSIDLPGLIHLIRCARERGSKKLILITSHALPRWERDAEGRAADSGLAWSVLRTGPVFGPPPNGAFGRLCQSVRALPAMPRLDASGGDGIQPLHVEDLTEAVIRCIDERDTDGKAYNFGHGEPVELRRYLAYIAKGARPRKPLPVDVPMGAVLKALETVRSFGAPIPAGLTELGNLQAYPRVDTTAAMREFRLPERNLPFEVAQSAGAEERAPERRPKKVLLVGAGRAGHSHALTLLHSEESVLVGAVDSAPRALALLQSVGVKVPAYADLEQAIQATSPDAVVLATPTHTRYSLARMCLERGISVLAERPLAATAEGLAAFRHLVDRNTGTMCLAGYQMAEAPHVARLRERLSKGDLGLLRGARAIALGSQVPAAVEGLWELDRAKSGGGCLIHFGAHALSLLQAVVPSAADPSTPVAGNLSAAFLPDIEDAAELFLQLPGGVRAEFLCTWSLPDLPESRIEVRLEFERGSVLLTPSGWTLRPAAGAPELDSDDAPGGYAPAPDLGAAGYRVLHRKLARGENDPRSLSVAFAAEEMLHRIYAACPLARDPDAPARVAARAKDSP